MNLSVALFGIGGGAALSPEANLYRLLTIAVTVVMTIILKRQRGYGVVRWLQIRRPA